MKPEILRVTEYNVFQGENATLELAAFNPDKTPFDLADYDEVEAIVLVDGVSFRRFSTAPGYNEDAAVLKDGQPNVLQLELVPELTRQLPSGELQVELTYYMGSRLQKSGRIVCGNVFLSAHNPV